MADAHEGLRAGWLERHGPSFGPLATSCERRAQMLRAKVRTDARDARGLGVDPHAERPIAQAWSRAVADKRAGQFAARWAIAAPLVGLPLLAGWCGLRVLESRVRDDAGRVPTGTLAISGVVSVVVCVLIIVLAPVGILGTWVLAQVAFAVPACHLWSVLWGWLGVPTSAGPRIDDRKHSSSPQSESQDVWGTLPPLDQFGIGGLDDDRR